MVPLICHVMATSAGWKWLHNDKRGTWLVIRAIVRVELLAPDLSSLTIKVKPWLFARQRTYITGWPLTLPLVLNHIKLPAIVLSLNLSFEFDVFAVP